MFDVNESLLRFWEKEFPQLNPKKGGRGIRQYRKEDIETVKLSGDLENAAKKRVRSQCFNAEREGFSGKPGAREYL